MRVVDANSGQFNKDTLALEKVELSFHDLPPEAYHCIHQLLPDLTLEAIITLQ